MAPVTTSSNFDFLTWLGTLPASSSPEGPNVLSKALLLCWQVWEARNNLIFKDVIPHHVRVLNVAGQVDMEYWQKISST
ncbi:unnamed protein product [Prunus armeniaca]